MAAITATDVREANPQNARIMSHIAGEAVTPGLVGVFDKGNTNNRLWLWETSDYDRQNPAGIILDTGNAGQAVRVAYPGTIVTGYALNPGSTAVHQPGNYVYVGDGGAVLDAASATVENARLLGVIVAIDTGYGILIGQPQGLSVFSTLKHNLAATVAPDGDNDVDEGYAVGSLWIDVTGGDVYMCIDNSDGAAVWLELGATA